MNAKKAKIARKYIRLMGMDPSLAEYKSEAGTIVPFNTGELQSDGKPVIKAFQIAGTVTLNPNCGRAQYQSIKAFRI